MRSPVQSRLPLPRKSESYEVRSSFFCFRVKGLSGIRSPLMNMVVAFLMMIDPIYLNLLVQIITKKKKKTFCYQ